MDARFAISPVSNSNYEIKEGIKLRALPRLFARISSEFYRPIGKKEFKKRMTMNSQSMVQDDFAYKGAENDIDNNRVATSKSQEEVIDLSQLDCLSEHGVCVICCIASSHALLFPCGHGSICYGCGLELKDQKGQCHICRTEIEEVQKIKQNMYAAYLDK